MPLGNIFCNSMRSNSWLVIKLESDVIRGCRNIGRLFTAILMLMIAGCASSGVVKNITPISTAVFIVLDTALVETSSLVTDTSDAASLLNAMIISGLQESGKFGHVNGNIADASSSSGIKIQAEITDVFEVSDTGRILLGTFAGRARILAHVTVSDLKSGSQIVTFEAEGKSSAGTVFAGTTNEAIQRTAERVVAEVIKAIR